MPYNRSKALYIIVKIILIFLSLISSGTVHPDDRKQDKKTYERCCRECGKKLEPNTDDTINYFTITPIDTITNLKDTYYLCKSCFKEEIAIRNFKCPECGTLTVKTTYNIKAEKYCEICGALRRKPNTRSHQEYRDYKTDPSLYSE